MHCDGCGHDRRDVRVVHRDSNGDPEIGLCFLCRKTNERRRHAPIVEHAPACDEAAVQRALDAWIAVCTFEGDRFGASFTALENAYYDAILDLGDGERIALNERCKASGI